MAGNQSGPFLCIFPPDLPQCRTLAWPGLGVSPALESQLTRHRNVLLLAPPRPVLVTGVKSVQINFMILTAHNARQRTGKILATILPV